MTQPSARRYLRQVLVLGEAGQARLSAATLRVGTRGFAGYVEALYAERAGFTRVVRDAADDTADTADAGIVETRTAREMLAGARSAARAIRAASSEPDR